MGGASALQRALGMQQQLRAVVEQQAQQMGSVGEEQNKKLALLFGELVRKASSCAVPGRATSH